MNNILLRHFFFVLGGVCAVGLKERDASTMAYWGVMVTIFVANAVIEAAMRNKARRENQ